MSTVEEAVSNLREDVSWKARTGFARQRVDQIEDIRIVLEALAAAQKPVELPQYVKMLKRAEAAEQEAREWKSHAEGLKRHLDKETQARKTAESREDEAHRQAIRRGWEDEYERTMRTTNPGDGWLR